MIQIEQYIRKKEVAERLGISISTIDRLRKNNPDFPQGVKVSKRNVRFSVKDINEYLNSRN